jgi:hypothetical protein
MTRKPVEFQLLTSDSGNTCEIFPLPTDEAFLKELLTYIFETYWREIVFGPMIQGGAFEFQCPNAPTKIKLFDGYLTVNFGNPGTHFHICIGENKGSPKKPTPGELQRHRKTSQAEFFRNLDGSGAPVAWGARFFNGKGEQQMSIFFPSPFLTDEQQIAEKPDWSRLAMWKDLSWRYLCREPDPKDRSGTRFSHG